MTSFKIGLAGLAVVWACAAQAAPEVEVLFADKQLTIRTDRYEIRWRDGVMVGLVSRLPGGAGYTIDAPVDAGQMPSGMGSFHGRRAEGLAQHHPWGRIEGPFRAMHPPDANSRVRFERIAGGAKLIYENLAGDATGVLEQELIVDGPSGDLVIRQHAKSGNAGVFGVAFGLMNLRKDVELIAPYFGGQVWRALPEDKGVTSWAWPCFWNAALAIGRIGAPESAARPDWSGACFAVWAEDARMGPKYFRRLVAERQQGWGFESCADAPYDARTEVRAPEWRFNTFGSWMDAAQRYKEVMTRVHATPSRDKRGAAGWAQDVALIWPTGPGSEENMRRMARIVDPGKIVIMDFGMLKGFNRRIPEYLASDPNYGQRVAAARKMGFHVGCYTSMSLVDRETHPTILKDYGLEPYRDDLWRSKPPEESAWLLYIHPGSGKWRDFYATRMRELTERYGLDFLYQDVAGCQTGSSGRIDDLTFSRAVVENMSAIRARVPAAGLAGEYWNEVTAARAEFGLATFLAWGGEAHRARISQADAPHPLLSYLFFDTCRYWPHQIPLRDTARWHRDQTINEAIGAAPVWDASPEDRGGEARVLIERARLLAEGFRPHFPRDWERGVAAYLRHPAGRAIKYFREGQSTYCLEQTSNGLLLKYARVTGVREVTRNEPLAIDSWAAYSEKGPIGLDPAQWYCVFPQAPPALAMKITALPEGMYITGSRLGESYALIELDGKGGGALRWSCAKTPVQQWLGGKSIDVAKASADAEAPAAMLCAFAEPRRIAAGAGLDLGTWDHRIISAGRVVREIPEQPVPAREEREWALGDQKHRGVRIAPPLGGRGSEYSIDGLVALPAEPSLMLKFSAGLHGGSGDGVHFVVRVNGREIHRKHRPTARGWEQVELSLAPYAGQMVLLSFAVDCGPSGFNTSCDEAMWGDVRVEAK